MSDIMRLIRNDFINKINKAYDNMAFDKLKDYGITRDNFFETKDRITICVNDNYRYFFVDNKYAFTITHEIVWPDWLDDENGYNVTVNHRLYVDCKMIGETI